MALVKLNGSQNQTESHEYGSGTGVCGVLKGVGVSDQNAFYTCKTVEERMKVRKKKWRRVGNLESHRAIYILPWQRRRSATLSPETQICILDCVMSFFHMGLTNILTN